MRIFVIESSHEMLKRHLRENRDMYSHEILQVPVEDMRLDAFIEDIKSRAPHKGKGVSLADGFNPPPLKGWKNKYSR